PARHRSGVRSARRGMKDAFILSQTDGEKEIIMYRTRIRSWSAFLKEGARSRRRFWKRFLCGLAAFGLFWGSAAQARAYFIYWSDYGPGEIRRANLDGTEMTTLVSGLSGPFGPALDFAGGMIWGDSGSGDIRRANLDGTGQTILMRGVGTP